MTTATQLQLKWSWDYGLLWNVKVNIVNATGKKGDFRNVQNSQRWIQSAVCLNHLEVDGLQGVSSQLGTAWQTGQWCSVTRAEAEPGTQKAHNAGDTNGYKWIHWCKLFKRQQHLCCWKCWCCYSGVWGTHSGMDWRFGDCGVWHFSLHSVLWSVYTLSGQLWLGQLAQPLPLTLQRFTAEHIHVLVLPLSSKTIRHDVKLHSPRNMVNLLRGSLTHEYQTILKSTPPCGTCEWGCTWSQIAQDRVAYIARSQSLPGTTPSTVPVIRVVLQLARCLFWNEKACCEHWHKVPWRFGVSEIHRKALFFEEIVLKRGSDSWKTRLACKLGSLSTQKLVPSAASFPLTKCGVPLDMCNMILRSELLFCFKKCSGLSKKKRNLHPYKGIYFFFGGIVFLNNYWTVSKKDCGV